MNYEYIENLVKKSKAGDENSKEKLVNEFTPYIVNLAKNTFIDGYEFCDIINECYRILFRCISLYDIKKHRFVAYATNGIKNSIYDLIKKTKNRSSLEGSKSLVLDDQLEHTLASDSLNIEDILCEKCDLETLLLAINNLTHEEKEVIDCLFLCNNTVKNYASSKNISYYAATKKKKVALNKIYKFINIPNKLGIPLK